MIVYPNATNQIGLINFFYWKNDDARIVSEVSRHVLFVANLRNLIILLKSQVCYLSRILLQ